MTKHFNAALIRTFRGYAGVATRLAKALAPNSHLQKSIHSNVDTKGDRITIRVWAKGPDARSREYGSGIWARRGPKGKILIRARNYPRLIFPWDVANENIPRTKKGHVILKQVKHPGVEAANEGQGYLAPAIRQTNKLIRKKFSLEMRRAIQLDIKAAFERK